MDGIIFRTVGVDRERQVGYGRQVPVGQDKTWRRVALACSAFSQQF